MAAQPTEPPRRTTTQDSNPADESPAGGWHALRAVASILVSEHALGAGTRVLLKQNKPGGVACVGCAWTKPATPHPAEFCDSGAKATAWEVTGKRLEPEFFAEHAVRELEKLDDHQLESFGRLTVPLRWDAASDRYREI